MENNCAFCRKGECRILYGMCRNSEKCKFRNTKEEVYQARRAASLRLASLSQEQQDAIAQKYYRGRRMWCNIQPLHEKQCRWWHDSCFTCPWEDCKAGYGRIYTMEEIDNDYD